MSKVQEIQKELSTIINGYDVTVTIKFFPHIVVLEDSSPELTNDESENMDISLNL